MTKIILCGASGHMGQAVTKTVDFRDDCCIVAGVCKSENFNNKNKFPIFNDFNEINLDTDVIIDFSNPCLLDSLLNYAKQKKIPAVICTTGYTEEQIAQIQQASKVIPIFFSGNTSIGVNLLIELTKKATVVLGQNFDIEIIEKHHNQKIDAPSGTALMIANAIKSTDINNNYVNIYDRHTNCKKREKNEIGIHSVRGGTIVGEHEVIFAGKNETVTISHSAQSKEIFAIGAIKAAIYVKSKTPGLYSMTDLLKN